MRSHVTEGFTWQALNAMAFFFKQVCGVENPVFDVKLRKTGTRVPVVLTKEETREIFEQLEGPDRAKEGRSRKRMSLTRSGMEEIAA